VGGISDVAAAVFFVIYFANKDLFTLDLSRPVLGETPVVTLVLALFAVFNLGLSFMMKSQMTMQAIEDHSLGAVQNALIIAFAFCESLSIFGVVLAIGFNYAYFFVFIIAGICGIALHFPKRDPFIAASFEKTL
jgi:hypothetical protein